MCLSGNIFTRNVSFVSLLKADCTDYTVPNTLSLVEQPFDFTEIFCFISAFGCICFYL